MYQNITWVKKKNITWVLFVVEASPVFVLFPPFRDPPPAPYDRLASNHLK